MQGNVLSAAMVYAILREQLGNQLFIWAAGFSLSRKWGVPLRLFTANYGRTGTYMYLRRFPVSATFLSPWPGLLSRLLLGKEIYRVRRFTHIVGDWDPTISQDFRQSAFHALRGEMPGVTLLDGLFQSWRYFAEDRDAIRRELQVVGGTMEKYCDQQILRRIRDTQSVSVHIRRTDYLHDAQRSKFSVCTKKYFERSINRFRELLKKPTFYVFSDDIVWARRELTAPDIEYVSAEDFRCRNISDFVLMANCQHHIISNSTFSWWAAYVGSGNSFVVAPCRWFNDDSAPIVDKLLPGWASVPVDG